MPRLSPVSYKQLVKVFEGAGFRCVRAEGDHMVFTKPGVIRPVVIPKYVAVPVCRVTATSNYSANKRGSTPTTWTPPEPPAIAATSGHTPPPT